MGRPTTTDEIITLHRSTMLSNKHNAVTSTSINELLSRSRNLEITLSQTVATPANFRDCNAQLNDIRQHIRDVNNSLESLLNLLLADTSVDVPTISKTSTVTHSTTQSIEGSKAESLFDSPKKGSIDSTSHDNQRDTDNDLPSIRNDLATVRNAQVDIDSSVVELTRTEEIYIPKKILYR